MTGIKDYLSAYCVGTISLTLFLFCSPAVLCGAVAEDPASLISNHSVTLKAPLSQPAWKKIWDRARDAARRNEKENALELYRDLFAAKPQIEEALREYAILLMDSGQWKEAGQITRKLLEIEPASMEYLLFGGRIALVQHRYERASNYFGQVYSMSPDGKYADEALQGQITALQNLGRSDMAYPLMEQLYLLVPHDETSIRQLAVYSTQLGFTAKAVNYYRTLISEFGGTDSDFLNSVPLFEAAGDQEMLVIAWTGYLKSHPFYLPFHKKLSEYYLTSGLEEKALKHLLVQIAHGEENPSLFLQTGKVYLYQKARPDKALYYYEEYRKRNPDDKKVVAEIKRIQAILANDLLIIVENEGAWNLWRDLAKVIPDRLAVYYSMAEQLEDIGKKKELMEVLEIIHTHSPGDQDIIFRLARLYFEKGMFAAATEKLDLLDAARQQGAEYYLIRAEIARKSGSIVQSLSFFKKYLDAVPDDYQILLKCLTVSGQTGLIEDLKYFYGLFVEKEIPRDLLKKACFSFGQGLLINNLHTEAEQFFRDLPGRFSLSDRERLQVKIILATILQHENRLYESEQLLRLALLDEGPVPQILTGLIQISSLQEDWSNSWKWFQYYVESRSGDKIPDSVSDPDLILEEISILQSSEQQDLAMQLIDSFFRKKNECDLNRSHCYQLKSKSAELYYHAHRYQDAALVLDELAPFAGNDLAYRILDLLVEKRIKSLPDSEIASALLRKNSTGALDSVEFLVRYGEPGIAVLLCDNYLQAVPDSLRAKSVRAQLLRSLGQDFASLESFKELYESYPDEVSFKQNILELQFKASKFKHLIDELAPEWKAVKGEKTSVSVRKVVPEVASLPVTQRLLLARSLWADRRFNDALALYKALLQPPVDQEFASQLAEQQVVLQLPPVQKSFFNIITFTNPPEPDRLAVVMSPDFTRENFSKPEVAIAAGLYSKYRWQKIITGELQVRQDMMDGNYYQAMKEYQNILSDDTSPESLYDLAGIYSRLGFLGKEAALYEQIKEKSPGYPDLDEAIQRNSLKRKPRVTPEYMFNEKEGRDGYYDIRQNGVGLQGWLMPSLNHELLIEFNRIYSESTKIDDNLWRNSIKARLKWSPIYDLDLVLSMGQVHPDDGYKSTMLYDLSVNGRIGDIVQGYVGVSQDIVDDTLEAVKAGINKQEYEAGITLDFLPRLFGGAEYVFTDYSDKNQQNRYELWTSYTLFSEPTLLQLRYGYEYINNRTGNLKRNYGYESGFAPGDSPYWSPENYWQHLFTVSFEHQLAEDILGRGAPSYYTLEYSFGYERGGYDNHGAKAQIFLEMSRHFLLNSRFQFTNGAEYQETDLSFSVIYRW